MYMYIQAQFCSGDLSGQGHKDIPALQYLNYKKKLIITFLFTYIHFYCILTSLLFEINACESVWTSFIQVS